MKLADALAERAEATRRGEQLRARVVSSARRRKRGYGRRLRSELMVLSALPVAELRGQADVPAREIREVDVRIQRTNREVDLLDTEHSGLRRVKSNAGFDSPATAQLSTAYG